jgi:hypothetical protein
MTASTSKHPTRGRLSSLRILKVPPLQIFQTSLNHTLFSFHSDHPIKWWTIPTQLLNSPIINDHYSIVHTFSGATAHSSSVATWVASLLLCNCTDMYAVEQTSWCSCSPDSGFFTAVSSGLTTNSYNHIKASDDWTILIRIQCISLAAMPRVHNNMEPNTRKGT